MIRAGNAHETMVEKWGAQGPQSAPFQNFFLTRYYEAYRVEMRLFADLIEGRARALPSFRDGIAALAIAEAATNSAVAGRVVDL